MARIGPSGGDRDADGGPARSGSDGLPGSVVKREQSQSRVLKSGFLIEVELWVETHAAVGTNAGCRGGAGPVQ